MTPEEELLGDIKWTVFDYYEENGYWAVEAKLGDARRCGVLDSRLHKWLRVRENAVWEFCLMLQDDLIMNYLSEDRVGKARR